MKTRLFPTNLSLCTETEGQNTLLPLCQQTSRLPNIDDAVTSMRSLWLQKKLHYFKTF